MNLLRHPILLTVFKAVVFVLMSWIIVNRLFISSDFKIQLGYFRQNIQRFNMAWLLAAVALMPVNWLIEVFKWRVLLQNPAVSFTSLVKGVMAGITVGFVTPGRTGEFIGRVMYMDEENKMKIFYLSSLGGIAQTVVTLMAGCLLITFWTDDNLLHGAALGLCLAFVFLYFRFPWFVKLLTSVSWLQRFSANLQYNAWPPLRVSLLILGMAFVRYAVYSAQYFILLRFFGVEANSFLMVIDIAVFLLAQTFSPLMPLFDFSFRGATALYVFKNTGGNPLAILCTVTLVWLINLAVPAVAGYIMVMRKSGLKNFTTVV